MTIVIMRIVSGKRKQTGAGYLKKIVGASLFYGKIGWNFRAWYSIPGSSRLLSLHPDRIPVRGR